MHTYGVNQAFRFVEGTWLYQKSRQIRFFVSEKTYFTSYLRNVFGATVLYKYHSKSIFFYNINNFLNKASYILSIKHAEGTNSPGQRRLCPAAVLEKTTKPQESVERACRAWKTSV